MIHCFYSLHFIKMVIWSGPLGNTLSRYVVSEVNYALKSKLEIFSLGYVEVLSHLNTHILYTLFLI